MNKDRFLFRYWNKALKRYDTTTNPSMFAEYPEYHVVEQCTGLKDKNGKLIYEGDVVKSVATKFIGHIEYNNSLAKFFAIDASSYTHDDYYDKVCDFDDFFPTNEEVEIIGNIHENPDLEYEERSW